MKNVNDRVKTHCILRVILTIFALAIIIVITAVTVGYRPDNGIGFLEDITLSNRQFNSLRKPFGAINLSRLRGKYYGVILGRGRQCHSETEGNYEVKKTVVVEGGDTLWSIARRYYGSKFNGQRLTIKIKEINDIENDDFIQPGQKLKLPDIDE